MLFTTASIIKPLRPDASRWKGPFATKVSDSGYPAELWLFSDGHTHLSVISAVEVATDDDGKSPGPEYHVSIARQTLAGPARCTSVEALWALDQFGIDGAEEDNHVEHGVVRNFWRTVADNTVGLRCACQASEPRIIENGGDFVTRPA